MIDFQLDIVIRRVIIRNITQLVVEIDLRDKETRVIYILKKQIGQIYNTYYMQFIV